MVREAIKLVADVQVVLGRHNSSGTAVGDLQLNHPCKLSNRAAQVLSVTSSSRWRTGKL